NPPLACYYRRGYFLVAPRGRRFTHAPLQLAHHRPAVWQPEGRAGRDVVQLEQIEIPPELAVVALLRLLEPPEMLVELVLGEPRGAVDPLQHRIPLVAPPVGAGGREELEVLHVTRRRHVGPAAEIE